MGYDQIDRELFKLTPDGERLKAALNMPEPAEVMRKRHMNSGPNIHALH